MIRSHFLLSTVMTMMTSPKVLLSLLLCCVLFSLRDSHILSFTRMGWSVDADGQAVREAEADIKSQSAMMNRMILSAGGSDAGDEYLLRIDNLD